MFARFLAWVIVGIWRLAVPLGATWRHTKQSVQRFWFLTRRRGTCLIRSTGDWWKSFNEQLKASLPFITLIGTIAGVVGAIAAIIQLFK